MIKYLTDFQREKFIRACTAGAELAQELAEQEQDGESDCDFDRLAHELCEAAQWLSS